MELEKKIIDILKENIGYTKEINIDTDLTDDINIDSFTTLMIINTIEDELSIKIDDEDFSKVKTVADIVEIAKNYKNDLS